MKILITAGGTKEYIDGVRYIGNCSSGQTGADLVDYLAKLGHQVTWLGAKSATKPSQPVEQICYETFDELAAAMQATLSDTAYDAVFQAAAVSDFKVSSVVLDGEQYSAGRGVKLPTADEVQLILSKQPKLVSEIKNWSHNPDILVVAFKLTNSNQAAVRAAAINKLIQQDVIDLVAHNDLHEITEQAHRFCLYQQTDVSTPCDDIQAVADAVIKQLEQAA